MKLPVVGYSGHRKGEKAENLFSKSFRDTTMQSQKLLRVSQMAPSHYDKDLK
jgi:hypothetical protein